MNLEFLKKLSEADGIASNEGEVRKVLLDELKSHSDNIVCDGLGSPEYEKVDNGITQKANKIIPI